VAPVTDLQCKHVCFGQDIPVSPMVSSFFLGLLSGRSSYQLDPVAQLVEAGTVGAFVE
jgi:hypothetical protein